MFKKILIANRGEIALRVMRTCKEMGIATVAVYSDVDRKALHARYADESHNIGPSESLQSYLNIDRIIEVAKDTGAQAIHPGYGFLAENATFAKKCEKNKIKFIGPSSRAMSDVGDKIASRKLAKKMGIPCTPGSDGPIDPKNAVKIAKKIGFPVILKASAGGGGMGMAVVESQKDLVSKLKLSSSSAKAAFGDGSIFVEKYLTRPRHIEFQIIADSKGNVVHLGERECSVQRRFQKLIEEAPSPIVDAKKREEVGKWACDIAKAAKYENAGTIEFLYQDGNFYFNEVNARLQVEHPVTEMVTGLDLVKEQINIAAGKKLSIKQADVRHQGWAIECRINAENPYNNFLPSPGTITRYDPPGSVGVRIDSGVIKGSEIPTFYDSLFEKIIVWAPTRKEAVARMKRTLQEVRIEGIQTNIPFHLMVLDNKTFKKGDIATTFIHEEGIVEELRKKGEAFRQDLSTKAAAVSVALALSQEGIAHYCNGNGGGDDSQPRSKWGSAGRKENVHRRLRS